MGRLSLYYAAIVVALLCAWQVAAQTVGESVWKTGSGGTTPLTILGSNVVAWYTADRGVYHDGGVTLASNGQTVQQWNDQSGNGYNIATSAGLANRPTFGTSSFNGKSGVTFTAANANFLISAASITQWNGLTTASGWAVGSYTASSGANARWITTGSSTNVADFQQTNTPGLFIVDDPASTVACFQQGHTACTDVSATHGTNYRLGSIANGSAFTFYQNGVSQAGPGTSGNTFGTNLCVAVSSQLLACGDAAAAAGYLDGTIAEIVFTNNVPNSTQISQLDNYFKAHWGL